MYNLIKSEKVHLQQPVRPTIWFQHESGVHRLCHNNHIVGVEWLGVWT